MNKEILLKRLSIVKLLYKQGVEQSKQSEATSFFSILSFHDCVDMFLNIAAEHINVPKKANQKLYLRDYLTLIPNIIGDASMLKLNDRRNNIKHNSVIPGRIEIEASRVNVTDFLIDNTPIIFGFRFEDISLFELVAFSETKNHLISSQSAIDKAENQKAIEEVTIGFYKLIYSYKNSKINWRRGQQFEFITPIHFRDTQSSRALAKINENLISINMALEIIALGLDYRKYSKFQILTPIATKMQNGEYVLEMFGERNWNKENCQFLIDFVVECALKLQEFDFSIDSLDSTKFEIEDLN